jgi:hypothetical protein
LNRSARGHALYIRRQPHEIGATVGFDVTVFIQFERSITGVGHGTVSLGQLKEPPAINGYIHAVASGRDISLGKLLCNGVH